MKKTRKEKYAPDRISRKVKGKKLRGKKTLPQANGS